VVPACALSATFLAVQDLGGVTLRQSIGRCHSPFLAASGCSAIKSNSRLYAALLTPTSATSNPDGARVPR
jgi:hypothetical protein